VTCSSSEKPKDKEQMWKGLFPDRGWYRYITLQRTDETWITGPFPSYAAAARSIMNLYFVERKVEYHWRRPPQSKPPAEEEKDGCLDQ
jgi:hypothetical protein